MIPINQPWIGNEEKREVLKVLDENALTSAAKDVGNEFRLLKAIWRIILKSRT